MMLGRFIQEWRSYSTVTLIIELTVILVKKLSNALVMKGNNILCNVVLLQGNKIKAYKRKFHYTDIKFKIFCRRIFSKWCFAD